MKDTREIIYEETYKIIESKIKKICNLNTSILDSSELIAITKSWTLDMVEKSLEREIRYSEEDLISFAHFYFQEEFNSTMQTSKSTDKIFKEWFEQFKKK